MDKAKAPKSPPHILGSILALLFGLFNLGNGILMLLAGATRVLELWVFILMVVLGLCLIMGAVAGLTGKLKIKCKALGICALGLSLALFLGYFFMRGVSWSYMLNIMAAFVYLAVVKD